MTSKDILINLLNSLSTSSSILGIGKLSSSNQEDVKDLNEILKDFSIVKGEFKPNTDYIWYFNDYIDRGFDYSFIKDNANVILERKNEYIDTRNAIIYLLEIK